MRLSRLLGVDVVDSAGARAGTVADARLVQDGPLLGAFAAWRLSGLIVVERRHVRLFGYERRVGPTVVRWTVRRLAGRVWFVPWSDVDEIAPSLVRTRTAQGRWEALEDLPDRVVGASDR
jgi:sporulation protein YlmC with PRC-barrel domain